MSDPDQIRRIEATGDVDRLHVFESASLPWWVRYFFRATKFHDDKRDLWFCPFESASNPTYPGRRAYLEQKVEEGYTPDDVKTIADLLIANVDDETLSQAMVQVVNRRFFGQEIPPPITKAAKNTLQKLGEAFFPWKYKRNPVARKNHGILRADPGKKRAHPGRWPQHRRSCPGDHGSPAQAEGKPRPTDRGNLHAIRPN